MKVSSAETKKSRSWNMPGGKISGVQRGKKAICIKGEKLKVSKEDPEEIQIQGTNPDQIPHVQRSFRGCPASGAGFRWGGASLGNRVKVGDALITV